jgi:hypothetical protein
MGHIDSPQIKNMLQIWCQVLKDSYIFQPCTFNFLPISMEMFGNVWKCLVLVLKPGSLNISGNVKDSLTFPFLLPTPNI